MHKRTLFDASHDQFRESVGRFLVREVAPKLEAWEARGGFEHQLFERAGAAGLLCPAIPEQWGGAGADLLCSVVLLEEAAPYSNVGLSFAMHSDIVANYLLHYGSDELKRTWLPAMGSGRAIGALAMTEPGGGSDVKAVRTRAVLDGDCYRISGAKTFISNATVCDLVIVVARTGPDAGARGLSLVLVDTTSPGVRKGAPLRKMGLKSQDTGELFFDDVRVPVTNRIGEENQGFGYLMRELPWERLQIAVSAIAAAESVYVQTLDYVRDRNAFGQAIADFQNTRFTLAELKTEIRIGRIFVDHCLGLLLAGELDAATASMAKYWTTELQGRVVDACVQLHGGYGFMWEYPVARAYVDARAQRIYGGANEIMKELIARDL